MNQSSIDRGFFRSLFFRSYRLVYNTYGDFAIGLSNYLYFNLSAGRDEEKKMGTLVKEDFGRPDRATTMVRHNLTRAVHTSVVLFVSGV